MSLCVILAAFALPRSVYANALEHESGAPELFVGEGERLLIIAPHPDDETLGAAGLAQRVIARGGSVRTVVVTAGDGFVEGVQRESGRAEPHPSDYVSYGRRRIVEASAAARTLSARGMRVDVLGFPDGGLLPLLSEHWSRVQPERSATTGRTRPPYYNALNRHLAYAGTDLRMALGQVMRKFKPTLIAFTDPLDEHADHHAVGMFTLLSVSDWMRAQPEAAPWPRMLAFLVHWKRWPPDSGETSVPSYIVDRGLQLPADLPLRDQDRGCMTLNDAELRQKQLSLGEHKTQQAVLGPFLAAFVRRTECFSVNTRANVEHADAELAQRLQGTGPTGAALALEHAAAR